MGVLFWSLFMFSVSFLHSGTSFWAAAGGHGSRMLTEESVRQTRKGDAG